jgi:hypothetical protein
VAKVGFDHKRTPWMEIHIAYVTGKRGLPQRHARLSSTELSCKAFDDLPPYVGPETLARWVDNADKHKDGETVGEKEFVDDLVTHNPYVIDLEMALPGFKSDKGASIAPRMDLVTLEDADGELQVVFWEAKLMRNKDLRRKPESGREPHVIKQLKDYRKWLGEVSSGESTNEADVIKAYHVNCQLLCALHDLAKDINPEIKSLDPIIGAARVAPLTVDKCLRVIVRDPHANKSWTESGHEGVLAQKHGIQVQVISGEQPASYVLQGRR